MSKLLEKINYSKISNNKEDINKWENEIKEFQNVCKNKYIYEEVANFAGLDLNIHKKMIKQASQTWLNIMKKDLNKVIKNSYTKRTDPEFYTAIKALDGYFEQNFPLITKVFKDWTIEPKRKQPKLPKSVWNPSSTENLQEYANKLDKKYQKKIEYSKTIWRDFQQVELDTISKKMCNYLFFNYGVIPVTVHDALYLSEKDLAYVEQFEDLEKLFWKLIDLKYYPENLTIKEINYKKIQYVSNKIFTKIKKINKINNKLIKRSFVKGARSKELNFRIYKLSNIKSYSELNSKAGFG